MTKSNVIILDSGMSMMPCPAAELARRFLENLEKLTAEERITLRKVIDQLIACPPAVMAPHTLSQAERERIKGMFAAMQVPMVDANCNQHLRQ